METSALYVRCPSCVDTTLIDRRGGVCVCAACGFDYRALAADRPAFEAFLVARMREGTSGLLAAVALHQWCSGLGAERSAAEFRTLAAAHGVSLPDPAAGDPVLRAGLAFAALVALTVLAGVTYAIVWGG